MAGGQSNPSGFEGCNWFSPGPNPEVSQTAFKPPHYKASFVMVRPSALSSRYGHLSLPSQTSTPAPSFSALCQADIFIALLRTFIWSLERVLLFMS